MLSLNVLAAIRGFGGEVGSIAHGLLISQQDKVDFRELGFRVLTVDAMQEQGVTLMEFAVGECYFIETLTKYWLGKEKTATATEVVVSDAWWVADTGYLSDFMSGKKTEYLKTEFVGIWKVPVAMITGSGPWPHKLYKESIR